MEEKSLTKFCSRCYTECHANATLCPSCNYEFSTRKRLWNRVVTIASTVSLFIGLLLVVINQGTQIIDRFQPTKFVFLGIGSATGTNRLVTDNFTLGIKSSDSITLEKLEFFGASPYSEVLSMDILIGKSYRSNDIANIRIDPTAIDRSYVVVPYQMMELFINAGVTKTELPFFFKIRPTSKDNRFYEKNSSYSINGISRVSYFKLNDSSHTRRVESYPVELFLWVRKRTNLVNVLDRKEFDHINAQMLLNQYDILLQTLASQ